MKCYAEQEVLTSNTQDSTIIDIQKSKKSFYKRVWISIAKKRD